MRRPSAFSLVELLVVIAIIALLLCMLLPMRSQIDRMQKETVCQHNLSEIGKASKAFAAAAAEWKRKEWKRAEEGFPSEASHQPETA